MKRLNNKSANLRVNEFFELFNKALDNPSECDFYEFARRYQHAPKEIEDKGNHNVMASILRKAVETGCTDILDLYVEEHLCSEGDAIDAVCSARGIHSFDDVSCFNCVDVEYSGTYYRIFYSAEAYLDFYELKAAINIEDVQCCDEFYYLLDDDDADPCYWSSSTVCEEIRAQMNKECPVVLLNDCFGAQEINNRIKENIYELAVSTLDSFDISNLLPTAS